MDRNQSPTAISRRAVLGAAAMGVAALASGAQSISYGDYHKTFRSVDEIREALADVEGDLAALGCGRRFARAYRFTSHKDL